MLARRCIGMVSGSCSYARRFATRSSCCSPTCNSCTPGGVEGRAEGWGRPRSEGGSAVDGASEVVLISMHAAQRGRQKDRPTSAMATRSMLTPAGAGFEAKKTKKYYYKKPGQRTRSEERRWGGRRAARRWCGGMGRGGGGCGRLSKAMHRPRVNKHIFMHARLPIGWAVRMQLTTSTFPESANGSTTGPVLHF